MTAKLRWGVLSTANIGRRAVIPAIVASNNGELLAVASRDEMRARDFARENNISRHYRSYDELLADKDIDAVYIPLPNGLHKEWAVRAAEQGKHVLCEKPLALTVGECREMQNAAVANGVKLMEAFMYRFHPRTEQAIEMTRSGVIGTVRAMRSVFTFKLSRPDDVRLIPELGGGALWDVGCYCVNASRTFIGSEPDDVQAWATWHQSGVDSELSGAIRFEGGVVAHFDCALDLERREFYEIAGTNSSMTVDHAFAPGLTDLTVIEHRAQREDIRYDFARTDQYRLMVEHFADCVLNDLPLRYNAVEAMQNIAVIEALYRSARHGGRVEKVARNRATSPGRAMRGRPSRSN